MTGVIWDLFLPSTQGANGAAGRLAVAEDGLDVGWVRIYGGCQLRARMTFHQG